MKILYSTLKCEENEKMSRYEMRGRVDPFSDYRRGHEGAVRPTQLGSCCRNLFVKKGGLNWSFSL